MIENIVVYGSGSAARHFLEKKDRFNILAAIDQEANVGKPIGGGLTVQSDTLLITLDKPFDLLIASQYYDKIYKRLQQEGKLSNPNLNEIYTGNYFKNPPPYGESTPVEEKRWEWLHSHFKGDYSHALIELIRQNRGKPGADDYKRVKDVLDCAGNEDYWKTVKGKNYHGKAVIIDCGAYIGDSIEGLVEAAGLPVEAYYAFEPMAESYKVLAAICPSGVKNFYPVLKAVGQENTTVETTFNDEVPADNSLYRRKETACTVEIPVVSIDSLGLEDMADADFYIKMDVEGSELAALRGAEKVIRAKKPNLAICLYHRANDIFEIPQYIDSLDLGYEFYMVGGSHTIMIAVPGC